MKKNKVLLDWGYMGYLDSIRGNINIVFIHGAGNRKEVWKEVIKGLGMFRCISLDLPGHGESSCRYEDRIEGYAERVEEFLKALGLDSFILVGHSMGGAIVIKLAPRLKGARGIVLVGTGATLWVNPKILKGLKEDFLGTVDLMVKWSFKKGAKGPFVEEFRKMLREAGREILYRDMYACSLYSGSDELSRIKVPTLIVCGDTDVMTPVKLSEELNKAISGSELLTVPSSGHMVHMERPGELSEGIKDFVLRRIEAV